MAISNVTWTFKKAQIPNTNRYIFMALGSVTGDATGGTITDSEDISTYFPIGSTCTLLDAGWLQNDNAARILSCGIQSADWESIYQDTVIGMVVNDVAQNYGGYFFPNINSKTQVFPIFLGRNLTGTFLLNIGSNTNTDTKVYKWWYKFLFQMPSQEYKIQ